MNITDMTRELQNRTITGLVGKVKSLAQDAETGAFDVCQLEVKLRQCMLDSGAEMFSVILEFLDDSLCDGLKVRQKDERKIVTLMGEVEITRRMCGDDMGWRHPLDEVLGLEGKGPWSAAVREAVSMLACEASFEISAELLGKIGGIEICARSVQAVAEAAGEKAEDILSEEQSAVMDDPGEIKQVDEPARETLIIAADGCQVHETDGWHEVKAATIYPAEACCRISKGRSRIIRKGHVATLEKVEGFGRSLFAEAARWGMLECKQTVVMGDGAPWIWNMYAEHFPGAIEIVDYWHACEHIWAVSEALWGDRESSERTRAWARYYTRKVKRGRVGLLIEAIKRGARGKRLSGKRGKAVRNNIDYFTMNGHRMKYAHYRRKKLPIGTGVAEGTCKNLVQSRFKKPGARWSKEGLSKMLALKVMRANKRWSNLWPHSSAA